MSKIQIQTNIDLKVVLDAASKLNVNELETIVKEFNTLLTAKKSKNKTKRIKQLSKLINQSILNPKKLSRYNTLVLKLENRTMSDLEQQEFSALTNEDEQLRNQRISYLIELSQLRQVPFAQLKEEFSLKTISNV